MDDKLFVMSDAGRSKSKRSKQKNDCTVRAVVETVGMPYDEVYDILAAAGRKCGRGFHFKDWAPTAEINGHVFKWISFPAVKGERRMNPVSFCRKYPKGKYILRTAGHVFAVVDGVMRDTFRSHDDRCVYGAFEVTKKEIKMPKVRGVKQNLLTDAEQEAIIRKLAIKDIMDEIEYFLELDREDPEPGEQAYGFMDAFNDVFTQFDDNGIAAYPRKFVMNMRDLAIAIQWYQEVTEEELERTIVSHGKKYAFKHNSKKYVFVSRGA